MSEDEHPCGAVSVSPRQAETVGNAGEPVARNWGLPLSPNRYAFVTSIEPLSEFRSSAYLPDASSSTPI